MSSSSYNQTFMSLGSSDGPAITAAARTSMFPTGQNCPKLAFPGGNFKQDDVLRLRAFGRISSVVTTPGTARFDLSLNSIVVFDTLAIPLNTTAQVNVPWWLDVQLWVRTKGAGVTATLFPTGIWGSPNIAGALAALSAMVNVPYNTAPVVGGGFDSTVANPIDFSFTQTLATGSCTLHGFSLSYDT